MLMVDYRKEKVEANWSFRRSLKLFRSERMLVWTG